jgi:hypothetical protein
MEIIEQLKALWTEQNIRAELPLAGEIEAFAAKNNVQLPVDLADYFRFLNGTDNKCDEELFAFSSLKDFHSIQSDLQNFKGVPDYSNIVNTLPDYRNYYVFADYMFHLYSYAIRLDEKHSHDNPVYAIIGDHYQQVAKSFSDFIEIYLRDFNDLFI